MRVLVTRPEPDGARTAHILATRGHEAVLAPILAIAPTGALPPDGPFDAVVVTSANGVPALAGLDAAVLALPVFAVGERTATVARAAGCRDVRAAEGDATSLVRLVRAEAPPGARLLRIAARDRKAEPEASLKASGFAVVPWVAYEAAAAARFPDAGLRALREGRLDAALHYSRRSAALALDLLAGPEAEAFRGLVHLCLSADTAAPLRAAAIRELRVAARPEEDALLESLDAHAAEIRRAGSRVTQSK